MEETWLEWFVLINGIDISNISSKWEKRDKSGTTCFQEAKQKNTQLAIVLASINHRLC